MRWEVGQIMGTAKPGAHRHAQAMLQLGEGVWWAQGGFHWGWSKNCPEPLFLLNIVLVRSGSPAALLHCL